LALAVTWDAAAARFETFAERDVPALLARLAEADLVVGFNVLGFDYRVLRGYTDRELERLPTFDLLDAVRERIGFRLPLGHLAEENLGVAKGGDGLQSLQWWREGRIAEIEDYCRRDVALLRDLFERALAQGHLLFRTRDGERVRTPTPWRLAEPRERARVRATTARSAGPGRPAPGAASACGARLRGGWRSFSRPRACGPRRPSVQDAAAPQQAPLEHLEVQHHEHVAELPRQRLDEATRLGGGIELQQLGEHALQL